ncbi:family 16 glycosylhydrolase [Cytobacillus sp. Hm23]
MKKLLTFLLCLLISIPTLTSASRAESQINVQAANSSEWNLVWSDEFNGNEIDRTKWTYDLGNYLIDENGNVITDAPGWGNNEEQYYTDAPGNSYINNGNLVIEAKQEQISDEYGTYDYTSAKLKTKGLFGQKYGKFEARIKSPKGNGLWPAFWLLPTDNVYGPWPASGEIDIMEASGGKPNEASGTIHYGGLWPIREYTGKAYHFPEGGAITDFHTYSVEWEPGEIRWYVDGNLYQTLNNWFSLNAAEELNPFPAPFDQEFYIILNLAVGGQFTENPDDPTAFPGKMEIDYVRVYESTSDNGCSPTVDGNFDFSCGLSEWSPYVHHDTVAQILSENEEAKVVISEQGDEEWSVILEKKGLNLQQDQDYYVSFDARSTSDRDMVVSIENSQFNRYLSETINLSSNMKNYSFQMTMPQSDEVSLKLLMGKYGAGAHNIFIDNVVIEPIGESLIKNGDFATNDHFWTAWWGDQWTGVAEGTKSVANGELAIEMQTVGNVAYSPQVYQNGIEFKNGELYTVTFDARSNTPRKMNVNIGKELTTDPWFIPYANTEQIDLTTDMQTFTYSFQMTEQTYTNGKVVFELGNIEGGNAPTTVYIDNVSIVQQ